MWGVFNRRPTGLRDEHIRHLWRRLWLTGSGVGSIVLIGCTAPAAVVMTDVNPTAWHTPATVVVHNTDTLSLRDVHIVVRSNEAFTDDTLTVHIAALAPDSLNVTEPFLLRLPVRSTHGTPLKSERLLDFRRDVVLADSGSYRFSFIPTRSVRGIEAIGIYIDNND